MQRRNMLSMALCATLIGLAIAWVDSQPTWDDTGISAATLFMSAAGLSAAAPRLPWLWALLVGAWIPIVGVLHTHNSGALLALAIAFVGAYSGWCARRVLRAAASL